VIAFKDYGLFELQSSRSNVNDRHIVKHQQIVGRGLLRVERLKEKQTNQKENAGVKGRAFAYFHRPAYYLFC
jgi:hypothetical protein